MLRTGTVSTNAFLRKVHNFAVDMNWPPATVIPRRQWPAIHYKEKRAITLEEHQKIIIAEVNPERKTLYQLCWHLGASQGDISSLKGEDVDWTDGTVSFTRKKTGVPVLVHLGGEALNLFKDLSAEGPLFPYLSRVRAGDRATEFASRCRQLGIIGVTLHSSANELTAHSVAERLIDWSKSSGTTLVCTSLVDEMSNRAAGVAPLQISTLADKNLLNWDIGS